MNDHRVDDVGDVIVTASLWRSRSVTVVTDIVRSFFCDLRRRDRRSHRHVMTRDLLTLRVFLPLKPASVEEKSKDLVLELGFGPIKPGPLEIPLILSQIRIPAALGHGFFKKTHFVRKV